MTRHSRIYRWFRKMFHRMVIEEEQAQAMVVAWHRDIVPCVRCPRPIPVGSDFCQYCGAAQERATDRIDLRATVPMQTVPPGQRERDAGRPVIITHELSIEKLLRPGERPLDAYNRIMDWRRMIYGD